jgi:hypothetical protein
LNGQGGWVRTNDINDLAATDASNNLPKAACEWSVLPDAGRESGDAGDILFVDDADDRGGPAQLYFDWAFRYYGLGSRVDRFDVLGPSSCVGNSLASRVKNVNSQIIGGPVEVYQKVLWNSSDLSRGLMGDGGSPNGGSSAEKSDDFGLCFVFLAAHPDDPGWAYWGDDAVSDWKYLTGVGAGYVKSEYMNHTLTSGDQLTLSGVTSPGVFPVIPMPPAPWLQPVESFVAFGGCPVINDFDVPGQTGLSQVAHTYTTGSIPASLAQWTTNLAGDTARFFLAGFGYDFARDDDATGPPDYVVHIWEILRWFNNELGAPTGIDPVAFENRLDGNYPNPFNPTTTIDYSIASPGHVTLKIYNAAGQLLRTLVDREQTPQPGGYSEVWNGASDDGSPAASGVYFYRLTAKDFSQTRKMVLIR